jgi:hypothetical protein
MDNKVKKLVMTLIMLVVGIGVIWGGIYVYNEHIRPQSNEGEKTVRIIFLFGDKTIDFDEEITTDAEYIHDLLDELVEKKGITYELDSFGMVGKLGSLAGNGTTEFIMFYSDDAKFTDATWGTLSFNGKTYNSASLGVNDMPVSDGHTYIFILETPAW